MFKQCQIQSYMYSAVVLTESLYNKMINKIYTLINKNNEFAKVRINANTCTLYQKGREEGELGKGEK